MCFPFLQEQQAPNLKQQPQQQQEVASTPAAGPQQWSFGSAALQNGRSHMEDRVLTTSLTDHPAFPSVAERAVLVAVFDGHAGQEAAQHAAASMVAHLASQGPTALQQQPAAALACAISLAEADLLAAWRPERGPASGSTVCMALLLDSVLHIAHAGDSRAVLAQGARVALQTSDHKPSCPVEAQRISAADPQAEVSSDGYLYGLGVSRGLGSAHTKADPSKRAYIATPEVVSQQLGPGDDFVVLATDGVWDKVGSQEAVAAVRRSLADASNTAAAAQALAERAQKLGSQDNIAVVVLMLHGRGIVLPKSNSRLFSRRAAAAPAAAEGGEAAAAVAAAAAEPNGATACASSSSSSS